MRAKSDWSYFSCVRISQWRGLLPVLLVVGWLGSSGAIRTQAAPGPEPEAAEVGGLLPAGTFEDIDGNPLDLRQLARKGKGLVMAFHSTSCPVSQQYGPTLARMEKMIREAGLRLIIVNPHTTDKPADIQHLRSQFPADVAYVLDHDDRLSRAMGARSTTEVFLVDSAFTILYRGAVDDQFTTARKLPEPTRKWLETAIFEHSRNINVIYAVTDPSGCTLDTDPNATLRFSEINYHDRISRIIANNCLKCHHTGGVAPFSLETYEDVKDHKSMIRLVVRTNQMPPWPAAEDYSPAHPGFMNDLTLTGPEKRDLLAWLDNPDLPVGDPDLDPLDYHIAEDDWVIGKPDLVVQLPEPVEIPAQGTIEYKVIDVDMNLAEDKWVSQWELKPLDPAVVHHALVFVIPERKKRTGAEKNDPLADHNIVPEFLFGYVPGFTNSMEPANMARFISKGSRIRFQIHYVTRGKPTRDQLKFGLKFLDGEPKFVDQTHTTLNLGLKIPAGARDHMETIRQEIPEDIYLTGFQPHMHYRGKSMKMELIYPDKHSMTLIDIPNWSFDWQFGYLLMSPVLAPKGSTILATAVFDNSTENVYNPDPTREVTWGPESEDEMLIAGFSYFNNSGKRVHFPLAKTSGSGGLFVKVLLNRTIRPRLFRFLDGDHDGFVTRKELDQIIVFSPELKDRPDRIDNLMNLIDLDGDHRWDFEEFDQIESFLN